MPKVSKVRVGKDSKMFLEQKTGHPLTVTQADRGENQREKSKVSPLPVNPCYTTLNCTWTHYLVHTDPMPYGPLTDSGCMYASYFTSMVTSEVKAEWSLSGAEFQLEK